MTLYDSERYLWIFLTFSLFFTIIGFCFIAKRITNISSLSLISILWISINIFLLLLIFKEPTFFFLILYIILIILSLIFLDGINTQLALSAGILILTLGIFLYHVKKNNPFLRFVSVLYIISWIILVFYGLIRA